MSTREIRRVHVFATLSTALALTVRLYWVFRVQSPYQAIYSDMNGYVERARDLLSGAPSSFPRMTALYPYGTHYAYAALFRVFGYEHQTAICIVQAVLCASPAYFFVLFASRFFDRAWAPGLLGILFAFWQPIVWCTGYFLSEVPYLALLFMNAWLCLRFVETKRGGIALGVSGAILFTVRPQFILTFALLAAAHLWSERGRLPRGRALWRALATYARVLVPWIVVLAFSIGRFHRLTGGWGLISENGQLNRLFCDTTVGKVEGRWTAPNGAQWYFEVVPPTKAVLNEHEIVRIEGYFADPKSLALVRATHLRDKSLWWRIRRAFGNVRLLYDRNDPWPEQPRAQTGLRKVLQHTFNEATRRIVIPLACLGIVVLRKRAALVVVLAHLVTLVVLSMFFLAEARYRVPYDPFLLLVASAGVWRSGGLLRRWGARLLARRRAGSKGKTPTALRRSGLSLPR